MATRTCEESLDKVAKILHTLVVWSNLFYLFAALIAFYGKHHLLGYIFLAITIISTIHHSNWNVVLGRKAWDYIDVATATGGSLAILVYGLWYVFINRELDIFKTKRTFMIGIFFVLLSFFALFAFGVATWVTKDEPVQDPDQGLTGPLAGATADAQEKVHVECDIRSRQIQYLIYHSIWHVMGGIVGVFFVTLITVH